MQKLEKECNTSIKDYIYRLIQSYIDRLDYSRDLNFIKNNKIGTKVSFGRYNNIINCKIGDNVIINNYCNLYGCEIGDGTKIGSFVEIQKNVKIDKKCVIQSHSFLCEGVELGLEVFISHGVMTTNDKFPKVFNENFKLEKINVGDSSSIGSNCTLRGPLLIGCNSLLGAHSLCLENIPPNEIWGGVTAKFIRTK